MTRFWNKVRVTPGCWLWTGAIDKTGYGRFSIGGRVFLAHRVSYEKCVGPIPSGLDLDHVKARGCTHRNCVNWFHLEPVTRKENLARGNGSAVTRARYASMTHCKNGHMFSGDNIHIKPSSGQRCCRACGRERMRQRRLNDRPRAIQVTTGQI